IRRETMEVIIVFIEEMNTFIKTREFAEYVSKSDSYYVLVSRWDLKNLPYSVEEIYKLTEKGKYPKAKQVYNSLEKY
ncbi:MAG: Fis family transcriptional regulator, partial [Schaedlerella arabinosiphila]|nr:Fis family transcriptional regulator [Schaedlerella arabinosiphila]